MNWNFQFFNNGRTWTWNPIEPSPSLRRERGRGGGSLDRHNAERNHRHPQERNPLEIPTQNNPAIRSHAESSFRTRSLRRVRSFWIQFLVIYMIMSHVWRRRYATVGLLFLCMFSDNFWTAYLEHTRAVAVRACFALMNSPSIMALSQALFDLFVTLICIILPAAFTPSLVKIEALVYPLSAAEDSAADTTGDLNALADTVALPPGILTRRILQVGQTAVDVAEKDVYNLVLLLFATGAHAAVSLRDRIRLEARLLQEAFETRARESRRQERERYRRVRASARVAGDAVSDDDESEAVSDRTWARTRSRAREWSAAAEREIQLFLCGDSHKKIAYADDLEKETFTDFLRLNYPWDYESWLCPISKEIFSTPVLAQDGQVYELDSIRQWLRFHRTSPMTNEELPNPRLWGAQQTVDRITGRLHEFRRYNANDEPNDAHDHTIDTHTHTHTHTHEDRTVGNETGDSVRHRGDESTKSRRGLGFFRVRRASPKTAASPHPPLVPGAAIFNLGSAHGTQRPAHSPMVPSRDTSSSNARSVGDR